MDPIVSPTACHFLVSITSSTFQRPPKIECLNISISIEFYVLIVIGPNQLRLGLIEDPPRWEYPSASNSLYEWKLQTINNKNLKILQVHHTLYL